MRPFVIVVEGKNDVAHLSSIFPNTLIVSVNGSAIREDDVRYLEALKDTHDVILCLDPDHAGERIRRILSKRLENVFHVFLDRDISISKNKKKVGVEHVNHAQIKKAFQAIRKQEVIHQSDIDMPFLFENRLIGHKNSKRNRLIISKKLTLGHVNGKTLLKRLRAFHINKKEIIEVLNEALR